MECSVCHVRSSVGFCPECKTLLCEVCGALCTRCGQLACKGHLQRTSEGPLCRACIVKQLRPVPPVPQPEPGGVESQTSKPEVLSFAALTADVDEDRRPTAAFIPAASAGIPVDRKEALNRRVLTASARKDTPIWLSSLVGGVASWLVFWPAARTELFLEVRNTLLLIVLAVSLGTVLWAATGVARREASRKERGLCLLGLVLGAGAAAATVILYRTTH